jgi:phosphotransferase system IIB component
VLFWRKSGGVIKPNSTTIQVVLGTKAEGIAEKIKGAL